MNVISALQCEWYFGGRRLLAPLARIHDVKTMTTVVFAPIAGSARAFMWPEDMAAADAAPETATLTDEDMACTKELRATVAASTNNNE